MDDKGDFHQSPTNFFYGTDRRYARGLRPAPSPESRDASSAKTLTPRIDSLLRRLGLLRFRRKDSQSPFLLLQEVVNLSYQFQHPARVLLDSSLFALFHPAFFLRTLHDFGIVELQA